MTRLNSTLALLFATFILAASGSAAIAQPSNLQVKETLANTAISRARLLISVKKFDEAGEVLMDVLLDKSLSDESLGRALLQKGNLGMRIGD